ncbi:hypothetical protein HDA30_001343 [Micrococcus cohnii]|uniref:Uncharacterized protein n=1 Tax=Micrococcus cohnii TaxID=993416 RepID=A0A7W7GPE5_9MICC|nr:hypothetical protein [Micrococcus cohnii]MBB4735835.1 hypothetical protein [Micrococcus cohnii]
MTQQYPAPFEFHNVTTMVQVEMTADLSTLRADGKIVVAGDTARSSAWADVTITDDDFEGEQRFSVNLAQARMMAAYFLNVADAIEAAAE